MGSALGAWHQHISAGCQPFTHGEARIPPSQLRAEQQEPGAGPEPPGSSSKARGAAPPGGHRDPPRPPSASGSLCPPPQGTGGPRELDPVALPSLSPLTNRAGGGQQPHPGACTAPGGAGAAPACGCAPQNPFAPGCSLHTAAGSTPPTGTPPSSRTVRGPPGTLGGGRVPPEGSTGPGLRHPARLRRGARRLLGEVWGGLGGARLLLVVCRVWG